MEKVITPEERIRRAEERYRERQRQSGIKVSSDNVNIGIGRSVSLYKKLFIKIGICLVTCVIFYLIKNNSYVFSEAVLTQAKNFLNYDMNLQGIYEQMTKQWGNIQAPAIVETNQEETTEENVVNETEPASETVTEENIETPPENHPLTREEENIAFVENQVHLIVPVEGQVSSWYGTREATEVVSGNHKGIDIAAEEGTKIVAAMDGVVTISSMEGSYGGHIQITQGEISTLYAHCKTLYVKEGETIKQGQEIAEVGQTGNATGPHLHFEILRGEETINPQKVMDI